MRKLFLSVLALIVLAGIMSTPSNVWSQSDCVYNEVRQLSDYLGDKGVVTIKHPVPIINQRNLFLQNHETIRFSNICSAFVNHDGVSPVTAIYEESEVSSWPSMSHYDFNIVNHNHDINANGLSRKRVAIYL